MSQRDEYISPTDAIDAIEDVVGKFPGYRRAHAKGIGFDAEFVPNGNAIEFSKAPHLQRQPIQTIVRFSHSSPSPKIAAKLIPVKGMAVRFLLPNDEFTNLTMANVPVFVTKTPDAFIRLIKVMNGGEMSVREKWRVLRKDPEYKTIPVILKHLTPPASFAEETYHALHSYYLVNGDGERRAARFTWVPICEGEKIENLVKSEGDLETELVARMHVKKVQFRLMIQLAGKGDVIDDSSCMWSSDCQVIDAGLLTVKSVRKDGADSFVFDPAIEVEGFELSDDPVLLYRSPLYRESVTRRLSEKKE